MATIPICCLLLWLFTQTSRPTLKQFDTTTHKDTTLISNYLKRKIVIDFVLPPAYAQQPEALYPVLLMNDGQDLERLRMTEVLHKLYQQNAIKPLIVVAVHCGDRMQEYGTASQADYKQRGAKAADYTQFVLEELLPHVQSKYRILAGPAHTFWCGFSLGGLSAFDITWHNPAVFGKVGVFSGSFWWRQKAYENHYDDHTDRIMQQVVRQTSLTDRHKSLKFWLQTGTADEKDDRNHNGIIDSVEDTLDLIVELEKKGYRWHRDLRYVEVQGGQHNPDTWSKAMPDFLEWLFL